MSGSNVSEYKYIYEIDNTSISGWVYAFTGLNKRPFKGAELLDYQLFRVFFYEEF